MRAVAAPPRPRTPPRPLSKLSLIDLARSWQYVSDSTRDRRLDLLRGYCVFAMIVDHLDVPTWLYWFTGGNRFFVSAAEGFVFISGLVMGMVYRVVVERRGLREATVKALKRAGFLYLMTAFATLGFMWLSARLGMPWASGIDLREAAPRAFLMLRTFYLTDVLMLYTLLVAVAPLSFFLLRRRLTWIVLTISWGIWAYHQLIAHIDMPWPSEEGAFFYVVAWQAPFFTALVIGWHRRELWHLRSRLFSVKTLAISGALTALLIWYWHSTWVVARFFPDSGTAAADAFAKWNLPPARLIACASVFTFALVLVHYLWQPIRATLGRVLIPLGESALPAYVVHLGVVAALTAYRALPGRDVAGGTRGLIFQLFGVLLVWLAVRAWDAARAALGAQARAGTLTKRLEPAIAFVVAAVLVVATQIQPLPSAPLAGLVPMSADRASIERPHYFVHVPPRAAELQPLPVLVVLHDRNEDPELFGDVLLDVADAQGWLLVAPKLAYQADYLDPDVIAAEAPGLLRGLREVIDELPASTGLQLRRRAMLFGYGRGASMAQRYALAYAPDVRSAALLGGGGFTVPPMDEIAEEPPFPFGVRGFSERVGRPIEPSAIHRIRWWMGVGAEDVDPADTSRAWDRFLGQTRVERTERLATILRRDGSEVETNVFDGVGHEITPDMRLAVADFLVRTRSAAPLVAPMAPPR